MIVWKMKYVRDGCEHELVDTKHDWGYAGTSNRGLFKNTLEGEILQISDISRAGLGESERKSPKEPLCRSSSICLIWEMKAGGKVHEPGKRPQPAPRRRGISSTEHSSDAANQNRSNRHRESWSTRGRWQRWSRQCHQGCRQRSPRYPGWTSWDRPLICNRS